MNQVVVCPECHTYYDAPGGKSGVCPACGKTFRPSPGPPPVVRVGPGGEQRLEAPAHLDRGEWRPGPRQPRPVAQALADLAFAAVGVTIVWLGFRYDLPGLIVFGVVLVLPAFVGITLASFWRRAHELPLVPYTVVELPRLFIAGTFYLLAALLQVLSLGF